MQACARVEGTKYGVVGYTGNSAPASRVGPRVLAGGCRSSRAAHERFAVTLRATEPSCYIGRLVVKVVVAVRCDEPSAFLLEGEAVLIA
jgi:hypothetical protein